MPLYYLKLSCNFANRGRHFHAIALQFTVILPTSNKNPHKKKAAILHIRTSANPPLPVYEIELLALRWFIGNGSAEWPKTANARALDTIINQQYIANDK